jgi:hypothetical protein
MTIKMLDPVGDVETVARAAEKPLGRLDGRRVGYVFNQHVTALAFWQKLEEEVGRRVKPASVHKVYKVNTWAPAPRVDLERLSAETDYVLVGVGA